MQKTKEEVGGAKPSINRVLNKKMGWLPVLCHHFEDLVDCGGENWIMVLIAPQGAFCLLLNAFFFRVLLRWDIFSFFNWSMDCESGCFLRLLQSSFSFFF